MNDSIKKLLLQSTVVAGMMGAAYAAPAYAQSDDSADEIVVTGSRIKKKDFTSNSPVYTVDSNALELSGVVNVEELVNELPQVIPGANANFNNPSDNGRATVDLRGLGATRTLVLVNGRRVVPGDNDGVVDLNNIPTSLVDRVEVVTGGASTVYGSDAVGGVVNFIMKDDFEGVELDFSQGYSEKGDAGQRSISLTMGGNFDNDRGNATLYGSWFEREGLFASERDFAATVPGFVQSSRNPEGRIQGNAGNPYDYSQLADPLDPRYCTGGDADMDGVCDSYISGGASLEFTPEGRIAGPASTYDYAAVNYMLLPQERLLAQSRVSYDLTNDVELFGEFFFNENRLAQELAATPAVIPGVPFDAVALTPDASALLATRAEPEAPFELRRRMLEVGSRQGSINVTTLSFLGGMTAELNDTWDFETYASYGRVDRNVTNANNVSKSRFLQGLAGCEGSVDPNCVTVNPFGFGSLSEAEADYLRLDVQENFGFDRTVVAGFITGSLEQFDLGAGPMGVATGMEYRKDTSTFRVSDAQKSGDIEGFNAVQDIDGALDVWEIYAEAELPLVADKPFMQELSIEGGYRYSEYSLAGGVDAYKVGGDWQPVDDIRFRATYQAATRAPNIFEYFQAGDQNFPGYTDPCNTINAAGDADPLDQSTFDFCVAQGVPAASLTAGFRQTDSQVQAFQFGEPNLEPEDSETITLGAVINPRWIEGLTLTVDYYDIEVTNLIQTRGAGTILNACFNTLDLNNIDCQRITRDSSGQIDALNTNRVNQPGGFEVKGIDASAAYVFDWEEFGLEEIGGGMDIRGNLTWYDKWDDGSGDVVGDGGFFGEIPEFRGNLNITHNRPVGDEGELSISWQLTYNDSLTGIFFGEDIPSKIYNDASVRWTMNDNFQFSAGVDNVVDTSPAFADIYHFFGANGTNPSVYDTVGRYFRVGAKVKL